MSANTVARKVRAYVDISYEQLEDLLGLSHGSIRTVENSQVNETIQVYHSDGVSRLGPIAEGMHQPAESYENRTKA
jgi:transcriptional regulator with XRE-family HTH domain